MTNPPSLLSLSPISHFLRYSIFVRSAPRSAWPFLCDNFARAGCDSLLSETIAAAPWGRCLERRRTISMKKPILGMAIMLVAACAVFAQQDDNAPVPARNAENSAAPSGNTSAAEVNLFETGRSERNSLALAAPGAPAAAPLPA